MWQRLPKRETNIPSRFESEELYEGCKVVFMNIPNIHAMRKSHNALLAVCRNWIGSDDNWLHLLDSTKWLSHLARVDRYSIFWRPLFLNLALFYVVQILSAGQRVSDMICQEGATVLIHCSDGFGFWGATARKLTALGSWDRTPQISSIAMLLASDFYRTLNGFRVRRCQSSLLKNKKIANAGSDRKRVRSKISRGHQDCL